MKHVRATCRIVAWSIMAAVFAAACVISSAASATEPKKVLVLHSFGREFKPWSEYAKAIRLQLERQSPFPLDLQEHALVSAKSSDENPEGAFVQYLNALFSKRKPDLIVSIGAPAAAFVQRHRGRLFPDAPMILTVVDQRRVQYSTLGPNDVVVAVAIDYHAAVSNILQVLPDTDHVAVVVGTSPIESFWRKEIEREVEPLTDRVRFTWYNTLSFEDILKHAAALPKNSAIFWELMIVDADGVVHEEGKALTRLHAVANAPIFSYTDAFFGREIVGGPHVPLVELGQQVGAAAVRLMNGESAATIKVPPVGMAAPKFDWRELQRWGIAESRLPPGSEVYFRTPTFWAQYHNYIVAGIAALILQTLVIIWLLYEHRRRNVAEVLARNAMSELHTANRFAIAGELSASVAHEVKQPLTTVAANAYAARNWLSGNRLNVDEARKALNQIVDAAHRASEIVSEVRAMFSSETNGKAIIDINELIRVVLATSRDHLRRNDVRVELQLAHHLPSIEGRWVPLKQVVHNLIGNAVDAMKSSPQRILRVYSARSKSGGVLVKIQDTGSGIDAANSDRVFKPLFSTKKQGMGMGLSICRSIIESHGGRIWLEAAPQGGAVFEFELPVGNSKAQHPESESPAAT